MDLREFRKYDHFFRQLKELSFFPDDPLFEITIKNKDLPLKARLRAPSRVVLEAAILRLSSGQIGEEEIEIKHVS